jgi:hypothetical protein
MTQPSLRRGRHATWLLPLLLLGCQRTPVDTAHNAPGDYTSREWTMPSAPGAADPDLVATGDGRLLLSWIDSLPGRRNALQFAAFGDGHWQSGARTIAVGDALVPRWANAPHMTYTADGALWVQWLQKARDPDGALDVMLARSADGGFNWSAPARINAVTDGADRGFVALWPATRDSIGVAWLDSGPLPAATPTPANSAHAMHEMPPSSDTTSLHAALFDRQLAAHGLAQVDARVCDCCQTDAVSTPSGALLVYRDRSADEVRDIQATRFDGARWSPPVPVHADHWTMRACPVNGPSVAAAGNDAVVAWYTAAADTPTVSLARSRDGGDHFEAPVVVERGAAVQGRVAVALDARQAWVLWLREDASGQSLWLARYAPDLSRQLQRLRVATLHGRGRATGYPQLALHGGDAYIAWTDVVGAAPQLHGAIVSR